MISNIFDGFLIVLLRIRSQNAQKMHQFNDSDIIKFIKLAIFLTELH